MQPNQNDAMRLGDRDNSKNQPVLFIDYPNIRMRRARQKAQAVWTNIPRDI
jgi:hypothetical protein